MLYIWWDQLGVLWAVKTESNHHRESVSNAIDAFESSIEGETATVPRDTRQSYHPAWQCLATCRKTGQDSKDTLFFPDGIQQLPKRWEKVVASDGQYFEL